MITLSTGSIIVLVTLAEKFVSAGSDKSLLAYSVICFLVCILGMLVADGVLVMRAEQGDFKATQGIAQTIEGIAFFGGALSFFIAIIFLAVFAWGVLSTA